MLKTGWFPKQLQQKVEALQLEEMNKYRRVLTGKQLLYQICCYLRTSANLKVYYGVEALTDIVWQGDSVEQINKFLADWEYVLLGLKKVPDEDYLEQRSKQKGSGPVFD